MLLAQLNPKSLGSMSSSLCDSASASLGECDGTKNGRTLLRSCRPRGRRHHPKQPHVRHKITVVFVHVRDVVGHRELANHGCTEEIDLVTERPVGASGVGTRTIFHRLLQKGSQSRFRSNGRLFKLRRTRWITAKTGTDCELRVDDVSDELGDSPHFGNRSIAVEAIRNLVRGGQPVPRDGRSLSP